MREHDPCMGMDVTYSILSEGFLVFFSYKYVVMGETLTLDVMNETLISKS